MTMSEPRPCALCQQIRPLCRSHIIPDCFYERLKRADSKGRYIESTNNPQRGLLHRQTGAWEYLLCEGCESPLTGPWDAYACGVLEGLDQGHPEDAERVVSEVDYELFRLFYVSILWRAAASSRDAFAHTDLGDEQHERLRLMILSRDPGAPEEYPCLLFAPTDPASRALAPEAIAPPQPAPSARDQFVALFGGFMWLFSVVEQPIWVGRVAAQRDNTLRILPGGGLMQGFLIHEGREQYEAEQLRRQLLSNKRSQG